MSKYKCECGKTADITGSVTIKVIDGAVRHDVKCDCGKYMTLAEKRKGMPSFKSNRYGQVR